MQAVISCIVCALLDASELSTLSKRNIRSTSWRLPRIKLPRPLERQATEPAFIASNTQSFEIVGAETKLIIMYSLD